MCLDFESSRPCIPLASLHLGCSFCLYKPLQSAFPSEVAILNFSAQTGSWSPSVTSRQELQHLSSVTNCCIVVTSLFHSAQNFNPLNKELNPVHNLLALLTHHILHVSRIRVKFVTSACGKDDKAWLLIRTQLRTHIQTYLHKLN